MTSETNVKHKKTPECDVKVLQESIGRHFLAQVSLAQIPVAYARNMCSFPQHVRSLNSILPVGVTKQAFSSTMNCQAESSI